MLRLCQVLEISESGYYAWRKREPSQRKRDDERLGKLIARCVSEQPPGVWKSSFTRRIEGARSALWEKTGSQSDARAWNQCQTQAQKNENDG